MGYGPPGGGDKLALKQRTGRTSPGKGFHIAFAAKDTASVEAFHAAGIIHGGRDNGRPGLRPDYGPNYFAAYLIDLDGHPIEAVFNQAGQPGL